MISLEEAQDRLLRSVAVLDPETIDLSVACGRILTDDVRSRLAQPPFAAASMDGYAIRFGDLPGPWRIIGESAAGIGFGGAVGTGEAVRTFTGAPLPDGSDTVLVQEDARQADDMLSLTGDGPPHRGAHVRPAGLDFAQGALFARAGTRLTPALLGLLAAGGHGTVSVRRPPRVTLIATGSELVLPGKTPGPHQIVSSNGVVLSALFTRAGAEVTDIGIIPDDLDALTAALICADADLIVTIGGASVGDHDLVVPALERAGAAIDFWKVALRPGKPVMTGTLGTARVLGLPGNPVSAFVCSLLFGLPLVRALGGASSPLPRTTHAVTTAALPSNDLRRDFLRATLSGGRVTPAPLQDSSMLSVLAASNALIVRAPFAPPAAAGEQVVVMPLDSDSFGP